MYFYEVYVIRYIASFFNKVMSEEIYIQIHKCSYKFL